MRFVCVWRRLKKELVETVQYTSRSTASMFRSASVSPFLQKQENQKFLRKISELVEMTSFNKRRVICSLSKAISFNYKTSRRRETKTRRLFISRYKYLMFWKILKGRWLQRCQSIVFSRDQSQSVAVSDFRDAAAKKIKNSSSQKLSEPVKSPSRDIGGERERKGRAGRRSSKLEPRQVGGLDPEAPPSGAGPLQRH